MGGGHWRYSLFVICVLEIGVGGARIASHWGSGSVASLCSLALPSYVGCSIHRRRNQGAAHVFVWADGSVGVFLPAKLACAG